MMFTDEYAFETQVSTTSPIRTGTVRELEDQHQLYHCHCVPNEFNPMPEHFTTGSPGQPPSNLTSTAFY